MMPAGSLARMVMANTLRSRRHFILSAFGIVIGIGAFVLFLALTQRAGDTLEKVFPLEEVQVVAPRVSVLGKDASKKLDDSTVKTILARPEVKSAVPRMALAFPAAGRGDFEGNDLKFEIGGFADGVDPDFVRDDERIKKLFRYWDGDKTDSHRIACTPPPKDPKEDVIQSPAARPDQEDSQKNNGWGDTVEPGAKAPASGSGSAAKPKGGPAHAGSGASTNAGSGGMHGGSTAMHAGSAATNADSASIDAGSGTHTGSAAATNAGSVGTHAGSAANVGSAAATNAGSGGGHDGSGSGSGGDTHAGTGAPPLFAGSGARPSGSGSGSGSAKTIEQDGKPVGDKAKEPPYYNPCPEPDRYYCDDTDNQCHHRVPIVLSATVVELYNNQFAKTHGMPMADNNLVNQLIQLRGLSAMRFSIGLGFTTIAGTSTMTKHKPRRVEGVVVGVSARAMPVGVTMPIQYIQQWNQEFMGDEAATAYSSIIVTLKDRNQLAPFSQWLIDEQGLRLEDSLGERFATVIFVIRLLFLIISVAILVIAVINIGHNFFIQVSERKREIGIMRAVGATEADVQMIVLGEAAVIGIVGGLIGIGLALSIGTGWNAYAAAKIPRFPFKPESWFDFKTWIWLSALGFSTVFCILGGYLPARRAAKMEPAQALAQN